jgi:hypothetical protein
MAQNEFFMHPPCRHDNRKIDKTERRNYKSEGRTHERQRYRRGRHRDSEGLSHLLLEIGHFFDVYKELEKKKTAVEGWEDAPVALRVIAEARDRFRAAKP